MYGIQNDRFMFGVPSRDHTNFLFRRPDFFISSPIPSLQFILRTSSCTLGNYKVNILSQEIPHSLGERRTGQKLFLAAQNVARHFPVLEQYEWPPEIALKIWDFLDEQVTVQLDRCEEVLPSLLCRFRFRDTETFLLRGNIKMTGSSFSKFNEEDSDALIFILRHVRNLELGECQCRADGFFLLYDRIYEFHRKVFLFLAKGNCKCLESLHVMGLKAMWPLWHDKALQTLDNVITGAIRFSCTVFDTEIPDGLSDLQRITRCQLVVGHDLHVQIGFLDAYDSLKSQFLHDVKTFVVCLLDEQHVGQCVNSLLAEKLQNICSMTLVPTSYYRGENALSCSIVLRFLEVFDNIRELMVRVYDDEFLPFVCYLSSFLSNGKLNKVSIESRTYGISAYEASVLLECSAGLDFQALLAKEQEAKTWTSADLLDIMEQL